MAQTSGAVSFAGFTGVALMARRLLLGQCPASAREKHGGQVEKLSGVFAWCTTVAREIALTDPRFESRDHATFEFIVNMHKIRDPLASIMITFVPDERDNYSDPSVKAINASLCRRPDGDRRYLRIRFEIEDSDDPDRNPSMYSLIFLDDDAYWRCVPADDVANIKAAIRECGTPVITPMSRAADNLGDADVVSLWAGASQRMLFELMRSVQGRCLVCLTRTTRRCTGCGRAMYCSPACQTSDYKPNHRKPCKAGVPAAALRAFDLLCGVAKTLLDTWPDVAQP